MTAKPITLPCLTVSQPWAEALVAGPKTVENRTWEPPAWRSFPFVLGIHAGSRLFDGQRPEVLSSMIRSYWSDAPRPDAWSRGQLVGVVMVTGCERYDPTRPAHRFDQWASGPYVWKIGARVSLAPEHRVTTRGALGLWTLSEVAPDSPVAAAIAQVRERHARDTLASSFGPPPGQRLD